MAKEFKIWCVTENELNAVLERFERDGYKWASNHKPTDKLARNIATPVGIIAFKGHIYFVHSKFDFDTVYTEDMEEFTVQEYVHKGRPVEPTVTETVDLHRGEIVEALYNLIDTDKRFRDLSATTPALVSYIGLLIAKIENELFK